MPWLQIYKESMQTSILESNLLFSLGATNTHNFLSQHAPGIPMAFPRRGIHANKILQTLGVDMMDNSSTQPLQLYHCTFNANFHSALEPWLGTSCSLVTPLNLSWNLGFSPKAWLAAPYSVFLEQVLQHPCTKEDSRTGGGGWWKGSPIAFVNARENHK